MTHPSFFKGRALRSLAILLLSGLISACASQKPTIPAISASGEHRPNSIVWHELLTTDLQRAGDFYSQLFGWQIESVGQGYALATLNGHPIAGLAEKRDAGENALWLSFLSVTDVDATAAKISAAGGKIHLPATNLPERGRVAVVADTQGVVFGLMRGSSGDPLPGKAGLGDWLWREVWSQDAGATEKFYADALDMQLAHAEIAGADYRYFEFDGKPRIGLIDDPEIGVADAWMVYVRVADPKATAEQAKALGGSVLLAPDPEVRGDSVAVIADPTGGVLVVQKWDNTGMEE